MLAVDPALEGLLAQLSRSGADRIQ